MNKYISVVIFSLLLAACGGKREQESARLPRFELIPAEKFHFKSFVDCNMAEAWIGDTFRIGTGGGVGIAVRKTDGDLKARINEALKTIRANGTYKAMAAKYFDFDIFGS
jgi:hypothetical protein